MKGPQTIGTILVAAALTLEIANANADAKPGIELVSPPRRDPVPATVFRLTSTTGKKHTFEGPSQIATVNEDGTVTFRTKVSPPTLDIQPPVPRNAYVTRNDVARAQRQLSDKIAKHPIGRFLTPPRPFPTISPYRRVPNADACFLPDGTNVCDCENDGTGDDGTPDGCGVPLNVVVQKVFDLNEYIAASEDPHRLEKAGFLAETFEWRIALARRSRQELINLAKAELPERLLGIWKDDRRVLKERRRLLFELWCEADPEQPTAGSTVRKTVIDFVQRHAPEESRNAFTKEELTALNKRKCGERFAPYHTKAELDPAGRGRHAPR